MKKKNNERLCKFRRVCEWANFKRTKISNINSLKNVDVELQMGWRNEQQPTNWYYYDNNSQMAFRLEMLR